MLEHLQGELGRHMQREEESLFPVMRIARGRPSRRLIEQSRNEHGEYGACLREIERISGGVRVPDHACRSWQALCTGTAGLVDDVMEHVHLENNVLFPRFEPTEG